MKRVLIVDDKEENLYYLETLLTGHGFEVERAQHGADALVVARNSPPDLVVSDLLMPVMDGYTLLRQWKADEQLRSIPFLVYTATYTEAEDERLALSLGADAFILKPTEPDEFLRQIEQILERDAALPSDPPQVPIEDEREMLKVYSKTLIRKLEEKSLKLVETNRRLEEDLARRREIEISLRASETNLAAAQRIAHVGSWVLALERKVAIDDCHLTWSDEMHRIAGYRPGEVEVVPALYFGAIPKEDRERVREALAGAVRDRKACSVVHGITRPDGQVCIVDVTAEVVFDAETNRPVRMVGTAHDITEWRKAEEEQRSLIRTLETERARLVTAQRVAKIGSWETDLETLEMYWSEETHRIFETDPAVFSPNHERFLAMVHPDDRAAVEQAFSHSFSSHEPQQIEHRIMTEDGLVKYVSERWQIFTDRSGKATRAVGTCRDVTDRVLAESKIRSTSGLLRAVADGTTDAVFVKDMQGRYLFANAAAAAFMGRTVEEVVGNDDETIFDEEGARIIRENDKRVIAAEEAITEEERLTSDGETKIFLATKAPYRDPSGRIVGVIGISRDITEKKSLEAQFLRAQRMESIGTLAGGIAHDLNNVLTPIMMSIELLKSDDDDPVRGEILDAIETSAQRGADMVKQVLSFARGVDGRQLEIDIGTVVEEVKRIADETFMKSITVLTEVPEDLGTVVGDPTQIHQVLLNLCVNARDAMPGGGVLSIRSSNLIIDDQYAAMNLDTKPGSYVVVEVADTGSGMKPEVIERIFEPFFTTKELGKGTGLGLSTTIAIVKSHGGFVSVSSELGKGTSFRVHLPASTSVPSTTVTATDHLLSKGKGETILVVDDEVAVREITKQTLELHGYRVLLACDGAEATALYAMKKDEIDAVFTDMMMPTMDGVATLLAIRRINPEIPLIAASGVHTEAMIEKASAAGVRHFLPKPYTAETMLGTLRRVLDGEPVEPSSVSTAEE
ncbi:MAG: response regulator [Verrucomicrobiales bacterium]